MASEKQFGTCKRFNATKGFGFITDCKTGEDLFVHHSAIYGDGFRTLGEGEQVEYDIQMDELGRRKAVNVTGPNGSKVVGDRRTTRPGGFNGERRPMGGSHRGYDQPRSYGGEGGYRRNDRDFERF